MTKIVDFDSDKDEIKDSVFILGSFESFHLGHSELLKEAKKTQKKVTILLFKNPEKLKKNGEYIFNDLHSRIQYLANLKVDYILLLDFNDEIKNTNGEEFLNKLLSKGATHFVVGKDFKMGKEAKITSNKIKEIYPSTTIVDIIKKDNYKISTSILKENLLTGKFSLVNSQLKNNYFTRIKIKYNNQIYFSSNIVPFPSGIYLVKLIKGNKKIPCILFINFIDKEKKLFFFDNYKTNIFDVEYLFLEFIKEKRIITTELENKLSDKEKEEIKEIFISKEY
ncbi:FAD synthase [Mesomycoplasma molare]|uniref:FAD synthase n=1 Tax=Mesomycoplasma molare TaxID=171288 RepID=A0ABY5TTU4_9BACT|nr:adenylyltransferase/cytidyltransferase family protein [Mesomycoplasma molare]UWD34085.1 adenylyltransferase/cytidyltransferase family protein [Mesomycoplasma molare]